MTLWITIGQSCGDDTRGKQQSRMEIFPVEKPGAELIPIATPAQGRTIEHISVIQCAWTRNAEPSPVGSSPP